MKTIRLFLLIVLGFSLVAAGNTALAIKPVPLATNSPYQSGINPACGVCSGGTVCCGSSCVNISSDVNNCGGCGTVCGVGKACSSGACTVVLPYNQGTCAAGQMQIWNQGGGSYCAQPGDTGCSSTQYACKNYYAIHGWGGSTDQTCCETDQTCSASVVGRVGCVSNNQFACISGGGHDATVCNNGEECCGYSNPLTCCGPGTFCANNNNPFGWLYAPGYCCPTGTTTCAYWGGWAYMEPVNCCTSEEACDTSTGSCGTSCPGGLTICSGFCVDTNADTNNCGSCGNVCPWDLPYCTAGVCTPDMNWDVNNCGSPGNVCYGDNPACCWGGCTDLATDTNNCGGCGNWCPYCVGSGCYDLDWDVNNCGSVGNVCSGENPSCCWGGCSDLATDTNNCGGCGNWCPSSCIGSSCVDLNSDPNNCGSLGNVCPLGCCSGGSCLEDMSADNNNCGWCGNVCTGSKTCIDSVCQCPAGQMEIANQGGGSYCTQAGDSGCSATQYSCKNYAAVNGWGGSGDQVCCDMDQTCSSSVVGRVACVSSSQFACVSGGGHDATVCNIGDECCGYSNPMTCCGAGTFCANNHNS